MEIVRAQNPFYSIVQCLTWFAAVQINVEFYGLFGQFFYKTRYLINFLQLVDLALENQRYYPNPAIRHDKGVSTGIRNREASEFNLQNSG